MLKSDQPVFEYACHEGNYGLMSILRGARTLEAAESKRCGPFSSVERVVANVVDRDGVPPAVLPAIAYEVNLLASMAYLRTL